MLVRNVNLKMFDVMLTQSKQNVFMTVVIVLVKMFQVMVKQTHAVHLTNNTICSSLNTQ